MIGEAFSKSLRIIGTKTRLRRGEQKLWEKLRGLKSLIKEWQVKEIRSTSKKIQKVEEDLKTMLNASQDQIVEEIKKVEIVKNKAELWRLYKTEEVEWRQRSRCKWVQEGD